MHLIRDMLANALAEAQASGQLPSAPPIDVPVEHRRAPTTATTPPACPLRLARSLRMNPLEIANRLVPLIPPATPWRVCGWSRPGFINFALEPRWLAGQVETVLEEGAAFGNVLLGKGESVQVEFVSINPTGPIHVGHARGGVLGDVLARVLDAAGFNVTRSTTSTTPATRWTTSTARSTPDTSRRLAGRGAAAGRLRGRVHGGRRQGDRG